MDNNKFYSIKELSELAGTDKQSIYRFLKKNHIDPIENQTELNQKSNANYYDEDAKELILQAFEEKEDAKNESQSDYLTLQNDYIELLRQQIDSLKKEIDTKNVQINDLISTLNTTQQANNEILKNNQILQSQVNAIEVKKIESETVKKKHWWNL